MTPAVARVVLLRRFRETMALCSMLPVGNDLEVTLRYCAPPSPRLKPMMLAVPCDITVLKVPDFVLIGILE